MNRQSTPLIAVAVLGLAWLAGCNDDGATSLASVPSTPPTTSASEEAAPTQWLFVLDAAGGTADDGTLTLRGVDEHAVSFSERPDRRVRRIPTAELVANWAELGFAADPPNASVTFESDGVEQVHTMTLDSPALDGDEVEFRYTTLQGAAPLVAGAPTTELPATFGPAAVFIDASSPAANTGTMTMAAITQAEYDQGAATARRRGMGTCWDDTAWTLCTIIGLDDGFTWSAVAQLAESTEHAAGEMTVNLGPPEPVTVATTPTLEIGSRWISITWDSPGIPTQGIGDELDAKIAYDDGTIAVTCFARAVPGLDYYCYPTSSTSPG